MVLVMFIDPGCCTVYNRCESVVADYELLFVSDDSQSLLAVAA